jgi:3-hydroxyisobutyrate dehydrogenase-like beta-hydroxyacid dehydrogenase
LFTCFRTIHLYSDIVEVGEDVGEALNMKLTGNFMVSGFAEVVAEGLTLAAATGKAPCII